MKQFRKSRSNKGNPSKLRTNHGLGVKTRDQRMRLWAARSMAFP